jgi:hypothetical protein
MGNTSCDASSEDQATYDAVRYKVDRFVRLRGEFSTTVSCPDQLEERDSIITAAINSKDQAIYDLVCKEQEDYQQSYPQSEGS